MATRRPGDASGTTASWLTTAKLCRQNLRNLWDSVKDSMIVFELMQRQRFQKDLEQIERVDDNEFN